MKTRKPKLLPSTERLLRDAEKILAGFSKDEVVIGGAVALAFRGFARYTADLDLFGSDYLSGPVVDAFRCAGYTIDSSMEPSMYRAFPPWSLRDDIHIDLLFPAKGDEDDIAIGTAEKVPGSGLRVISSLGLALSRLYSDDPKHEIDLLAMIKGKMFSVSLLRKFVKRDKEALERLDRIAATARKKINPPWAKNGRWRR